MSDEFSDAIETRGTRLSQNRKHTSNESHQILSVGQFRKILLISQLQNI